MDVLTPSERRAVVAALALPRDTSEAEARKALWRWVDRELGLEPRVSFACGPGGCRLLP